jgi:hypothetical protein
MQVLLGLLPLAPFKTVVLDPHLPGWMPDVILHDLRVGDARVTIRFWRDRHDRSHFEVLNKTGTLHVVRQPPPESIEAGFAVRAGAAVETVLRAVS